MKMLTNTKYFNRVLFNEPYENKHKIERAFKNMYSNLFKSIIKISDTELNKDLYKNNWYFENNLKKLEINI
jgi:hypothetical protein